MPAELAAEARASVDAGAEVLHLHVYDTSGRETFAPTETGAALRAVRAACPGVAISLSTSADIEPHPARLRNISDWIELPELVTANQGEAGIIELYELLVARSVGIEAGLLELADAHRFVRSGIVDRCARVLIEPLDVRPAAALDHAAAMEQVIAEAGIGLQQVHHGDGVATWHVIARAISRGHGIRAGLEDTTLLPDGMLAQDNATLVRLAMRMKQGEDIGLS